MAYDTQDLLEKAKAAIQENNLIFIEEVVSFLPCSKATFYDHFPLESNELNELKELTNQNKVALKVDLRGKWRNSDSAPLQLALYKLAATPEELKQLQMTHVDHTTNGQSFNIRDLIGFKDA